MLVTNPAQSPDDLGPRHNDSGSKPRDQSPSGLRRVFSGGGLQQLLGRRGSGPIGHNPASATPATASSTKSPAASSAAAVTRKSGPLSWAKRKNRSSSMKAQASDVAVSSEATAVAGTDVSQQDQPAPAAASAPNEPAVAPAPAAAATPEAPAVAATATAPPAPAPAAPLLEPSPVVMMTDLDTNTATEPPQVQHPGGKRKHLEGANSAELLYEAHAKSPAHVSDTSMQQQEQQPPHADSGSNSEPNQQQQQQQQQEMQQQQQQQQSTECHQDDIMQDVDQQIQPQDSLSEQQSPFMKQDSPTSGMQQQQQQHGKQLQNDSCSLPLQKEVCEVPAQLQHSIVPPQQPQPQQQQGRLDDSSTSPVSHTHGSSPGPSSSSEDMKPPNLVDMARKVLGKRPELFGAIDGVLDATPTHPGGSRLSPLRRSQSGHAAAPSAAFGLLPPGAPLRTSSHDVSMMGMSGPASSLATASMQAGSRQGVSEGAMQGGPLSSELSFGMPGGVLSRELSFGMDQQLPRQLSSAASLEVWLGPGSRTTSGSPRSLALERQHLLRTNSNLSSGSGQGSMPPQQNQQGGQGSSVVFGPMGAASVEGAALDKQASFAGWPDFTLAAGGRTPAATAAAAAAATSGLAPAGGSFSWPPAPPALPSEGSLKLDIQMMPAVVPEQYPREPSPGSAAAEHDGHLQLLDAQQQQQQVDSAFFAKVAAWEDELVDMLESQSVPVAIRDIVAVFKDRIHSDRDKAEFKTLCDKWTGVVEYPGGSGVKCLAIKSWMRGTHVRHYAQHFDDNDSSDDVGDWDD